MRLFCCLLVLFTVLAAPSAIAADGKVLRMAYDSDPISLDPHEELSGATLQMSQLLFDPLVRFGPNMTLQPRLALRWTKIDARTTRFFLRPNVKFHSGRTLSANDVVWTFNRLKKSPDFKALFAPFEGARVINKLTVDLITKKPYPLVMNLATYIFPMDRAFYTGTDSHGQPKDAIIKHGDSFASRHESGTGPFELVSWQPGVRMVLKRFPEYWDKKSPGNIEKIIFTPIKQAATRVAALLSGDVDFISPVPPGDLTRVADAPCCTLVTMRSTRVLTLELNENRVTAFRDRRVRQAVSYAIDRQAIVKKIMRGFAQPAGQLSPPGYAGYVDSLVPRYNLEKARQLMREAGYASGFHVTLMAPNNRYVEDYRIAQAVAAMLAKINIRVDLRTMPKAQYWKAFDAREGDIMMIGWQSDTQDSASMFEFLLMSPNPKTGYGQYNAGDYTNPELDKLTLQTQTMTDPDARAAVLKKIERIIYNDAAIVPLQWQYLSWGARKNVEIKPVLNRLDMPYLGDLVMK